MIKLKIKNSRLSVFNKDVVELISKETGVFLAGGCFRTLVNKSEPISDYDMFFTKKECVEVSKKHFEKKGWSVVFVCPRGELTTLKKGDLKVQLITKRLYSNVEDAVNSFDITACCVGYEVESASLICHEDWVKHVKGKTLAFNTIEYPVATINRIVKYYNKGYRYSETSLKDYVMMVSDGKFDPDSLSMYID